MDKKVIKVKSVEEWDTVLRESGDKLIVANFRESNTQSSDKMAPVFRDMSETYEDVTFIELDSEEVNALFYEYDIIDTPTFVVFRDGENVGQVLGTNHSILNRTIDKHYSNPN